MLRDNLYDEILISPAVNGSSLYIVSGYATSAMAARHIKDIVDLGICEINIQLVIGMTAKDGIGETNHNGFCSLSESPLIKSFQCAYIPDGKPPVHTKAYAWFRGDNPLSGHIGSANYTQTGFFSGQKEAMETSDPREVYNYYKTVRKTAVFCHHQEIQGLVRDDRKSLSRPDADDSESMAEQNAVTYSLLDNSGNLPATSGLNWGQRSGRELNQAYIRIPSDVQKAEFFPPRGGNFALHTDDGQTILCNISQDKGKAIHSSQNNSLLGEYFRQRLGVPLGERVEKSHLMEYGRTDVTFYKIDDENYIMDFSVPEA